MTSHLTLCAPCSSVKGGINPYLLDVIHTKGPSYGRGFVSGSQHRCFHVTSHLAHALDSTAESRQVPHRSPVHGFGWHHEGDSLEFHLHNLHQPQEGKRGSAFPWASGIGGHLVGRQAQDVLCQSQVCSKVLSAIFRPSCPYLCAQARGPPQPSLSPLKTVPGRHLKMGSLAFLGFPFLTPGIQASSRVH